MQKEIVRITEAWNDFSTEVLQQLLALAAKGKRGWDKEYPRSSIFKEIQADLRTVRYSEEVKRLCSETDELKLCLDIAAHVMFIYHRRKKEMDKNTSGSKSPHIAPGLGQHPTGTP